MKKTRSVSEIQADLDYHNRSVSWTMRRSGVEGTEVSRDLVESMLATSRRLEEELRLATSRRLEEELRLAQAREKKKIS